MIPTFIWGAKTSNPPAYSATGIIVGNPAYDLMAMQVAFSLCPNSSVGISGVVSQTPSCASGCVIDAQRSGRDSHLHAASNCLAIQSCPGIDLESLGLYDLQPEMLEVGLIISLEVSFGFCFHD